MKKHVEQFFLYRYRFIIGYILLSVAFFILLTSLPGVAPTGLSEAEMASTVQASALDSEFIKQGNIINLPYFALQKGSLAIFGLNLFAIKLPSMIIAVATAIFIILLLNRWFKSDVAIVGSVLTVLSTAFLFLATSGTPAIMYIFWLALVLWLGSKIVGNDNVNPLLVIFFFISIALSLYTPYLAYVALAITVAGLIHPHLRFALKQLKIYQLILCILIFVLSVAPLVISCVLNPSTLQNLLFTNNLSFGGFIANITNAFAPFFSFSLAYSSVYLAPLFGLATVALVIIGILASAGKMFMSRNTVVSLLVIFSIFLSGLSQDVAISIIIPIAILSAAGIESIVEKWYTLFPENPYAHLLGIVPMVAVMIFIISSGLSHFIFGYHYIPRVVNNFNNDLTIVKENVPNDTTLILTADHKNNDFLRLLEKYDGYQTADKAKNAKTSQIASFNPVYSDKYDLKQIITSPNTRNSDRLYIYSLVTEKGEE